MKRPAKTVTTLPTAFATATVTGLREGIVIEDTLRTMNLWLAITAVVSVVEALLLIAMGIGAYLAYRRVMVVAGELERRHVAPLMSRVSAILEDVNGVTIRVRERTERVDHAIRSAVDLVDHTGRRMEMDLRFWVREAIAVLYGVRAAFAVILRGRNEDATDARPST